MKMQLIQHSFSMDQQRRIMQQIQVINKKLVTNPYSSKISHLQQNIQKQKHNQQQQDKYFSQQCDDLFDDNLCKNNICKNNQDNNKSYQDSLFNSNEMLLGNQYQKQIRNFKEFQTDKFSSHNHNQLNGFNKNIIQTNKSNYNSKNSKNSQLPLNQIKQNNQNQKKSLSKNTSQSNLNNKNKSHQINKNLAQSKIKKYIENKQNILPAANLQTRQKSFIKEVRKKIRFQTQPDYPTFNNREDSLEIEKYSQLDNNFQYLLQQASNNYDKSRNKNEANKNPMQCTFRPNILKKSNQIAQNLQPSFQRLTQDIGISKSQSKLPYKTKEQLTSKKYSAKRLEQLSQPRKPKISSQYEQPKYDFQPCLSKKSLQQMANCTMDVASRNKLWLEQKQAKISKLKIEEQQNKRKKQMGCFVPKLTAYKGQSEVHLSRFTKDGISSYFQRVSMAKQKNQTQQKKKIQYKQQMKESNVNMKKKTYDEAVKELHKKILAMNL